MKSIEERIKFFKTILREDLIEKKCKEIVYGGNFIVGNNFVKMERMVIGAIVPKEDMCNLDFNFSNIGIITLDLEVRKDLNNNKLRLRINGNRLKLCDMETFDKEEYIENYIDNLGYEEKYRLCEEYDCSPLQLISEIAENEDITEIIGDCGLVNINDNDFLVMSDSGWDLYNIIKDIQEDEKIIWFGNPIELLETIKKYNYSYLDEVEDLTEDDLHKIGVVINKICKEQNVLNKIIDYVEEN